MDLRDSPDEARFRADLRQWLVRTLGEPDPDGEAATARWADRDFLRSFTRRLQQAGYAGLSWPAEYGGQGQPVGLQAIFLEETARFGAAEQAGVIGLGMVGPTLIAWGTPGQKEWYLPRILAGDVVFCQGFSEPDAGSDLAAVRTRARLEGDEYVVTGRKVWSSYAPVADHCLLLARTATGDRPHDGLTCLLVDLRAPGVTVQPIRQLTGEADFGEVVLDRARVPATAALGPPGQGWRVAMTTLAHERGTFGFTLTARLETQFHRLVATVRACGAQDDPLVRDRLAASYVELGGLRWTSNRALAVLARTGTPAQETALLKLRWAHAHQELTALGVEVAARGDGERIEFWRRYWRCQQLRSRGNSIEGGTSQILRDVIATRVLGLPRAR